MNAVKKILIYIGFILLNIGMVVLGYFFYFNFVRQTTTDTITPDYFQEIIAVVLLMIGLPVLTLKPFKIVRPVSFGIMALLIPGLLYGIFFINKVGSMNSYERLYPIESSTKQQNNLVLETYIYEKSKTHTFVIPPDDCMKMDSLQIKIMDGLLGMKIITNQIRTIKKPGCGS